MGSVCGLVAGCLTGLLVAYWLVCDCVGGSILRGLLWCIGLFDMLVFMGCWFGWLLLDLYCCAYCFLLGWLFVCLEWLCFSLGCLVGFCDLWFCLLLGLVGIFDCGLDGYVACRCCGYAVVLFGFA